MATDPNIDSTTKDHSASPKESKAAVGAVAVIAILAIIAIGWGLY